VAPFPSFIVGSGFSLPAQLFFFFSHMVIQPKLVLNTNTLHLTQLCVFEIAKHTTLARTYTWLCQCQMMLHHFEGGPEPYIYTVIRCTYGIFGREITLHTVMYSAYIRFWPTPNNDQLDYA
jgi:hypothetical protein